MDKKIVFAVVAGVVIGIVLGPQIAKIPFVNKIPTV